MWTTREASSMQKPQWFIGLQLAGETAWKLLCDIGSAFAATTSQERFRKEMAE